MDASLPTGRSSQRSWLAVAIAVAVAVAIPIATWYMLYRWAGYGTSTRVSAHLAFFVAAIALAALFRIPARSFGLTARDAMWAAGVGALAYGVVMGGGAAFNAVLGTEFTVLRSRYDPIAFLDTWVLTALGEELLFAGVVFTLVAAALPREKRWWAVLLTALTFAAMHLPGYLAVGHATGAILGRLALNAVSWGIFGTIYLLSGNLWLVVVAHAATDLALTPLVTNEPVWGLVFMALLVAGAWWQGGAGRSRPPVEGAAGPGGTGRDGLRGHASTGPRPTSVRAGDAQRATPRGSRSDT